MFHCLSGSWLVSRELEATGQETSWGKCGCFSCILHLLSPEQVTLHCDRVVCLCSSRFIWESQPENTHAFHSFFLSDPVQPHVSPPPPPLPVTLSSSPLHRTIRFSGHMESVQGSLLLVVVVVWAQMLSPVSLPYKPPPPFPVSPPVVFWVRGKDSPALLPSLQKLWRLLYRASYHSTCNSGTYSTRKCCFEWRVLLNSSSTSRPNLFEFNFARKQLKNNILLPKE